MAVSPLPLPVETIAPRTDICGDACVQTRAVNPHSGRLEWVILHSPIEHARLCAACLADPMVASAPGPTIVRTGPLVIDLLRARAFLSGRELDLTPTEWRFLAVLARNVGALTPISTLASQLRSLAGTAYNEAAAIRMGMMRVRRKLGSAASLIETRIGRGYELLLVPSAEAPA